jgi:hypothetical protein
VSVKRSINAVERPLSRPRSTSLAFTSTTSPARSSSAVAIASSAESRALASARASTREASFAAAQTSATEVPSSELAGWIAIATRVPGGAYSSTK